MAILQKLAVCVLGLLVSVCLVSANQMRRDNPVCIDPPMDLLERQLSSKLDLHPTFLLFPPLQDTVQTLDKFQLKFPDMVKVNFTYMSRTSMDCTNRNQPIPVQNGAAEPCPVDYVFNYDANRVPDTLVEASCRCSETCFGLTPTTISPLATLASYNQMGCQPVKYYVKVLRKRTCPNTCAMTVYDVVWEPITVACACRGPTTRTSGIYSSNPAGRLPSSNLRTGRAALSI